jgi:hypothetical protein
MAKEIEITIDEDGTVHMEALGFEGKGCHETLAEIQRVLGRVKGAKRKAEFYDNKVKVTQKVKK